MIRALAARIRGVVAPARARDVNVAQAAVKAEKDRLLGLPRYEYATTSLLGAPFGMVDGHSFIDMYEEIFEREIYRFGSDSPQPRVIDCGANVGVSVIYFKRLFPQSRILALEPDPRVCSVLRENVRAAGLEGVEVLEGAAWSTEGELEFFAEGSYAGTLVGPAPRSTRIPVRAVRLRDLLVGDVDLLKMDIEGSETDVLLDCADALSGVKRIFVEYHSFAGRQQSLGAVVGILHDAGFRLHVQAPSASPRPFVERAVHYGMDMQLNLFGYRP